MAIYKTGTPSEITGVVKTDADFEQMRKRIAGENNLLRCKQCGHLLAKKSADGALDIQHKRAAILVEDAKQVRIQCPVCRQVNGDR